MKYGGFWGGGVDVGDFIGCFCGEFCGGFGVEEVERMVEDRSCGGGGGKFRGGGGGRLRGGGGGRLHGGGGGLGKIKSVVGVGIVVKSG